MAVFQHGLEYDREVWNTYKCQAKALKPIQSDACKHVLGCSLTICDECACKHLGFELYNTGRFLLTKVVL